LRIIVKFTATLLIGTCGILTCSAVYAWNREMSFFEHDMRLDHMVVGDAVVAMVRKTWAEQGKEAAMRVPHAIDQGKRHLSLTWIDGDSNPDPWAALPATVRAGLQTGTVTETRDAVWQHSFVPIRGPAGELAALEIREPLAEEQEFGRGSLLQQVVAAAAVVALCTLLTAVLGWLWLGRPIQSLCDGARRIGRGDLGGSVEIAGNNELSLLAGEMNAMCRDLARAHDRLASEMDRRMTVLEQLRHADRLATVGKLASGIAHELGTPLNVVWAYANMIARGEVTGQEVVDGAKTIADQSAYMTAIIRQLLDFARPRTAVRSPTDLVGLARQTLSFLETMAQKRSVRLGLHGSGEALAEIDGVQVQQVLTNLVVNAIQALPAGGQIDVVVSQRQVQAPPERGGGDGVWQCIEVRDNGVGIQREHLPHLFEPFFTTKGVGEGTGLGLSVSRGIVMENGGWIAVDSTPGQGACFAVFLPGVDHG